MSYKEIDAIEIGNKLKELRENRNETLDVVADKLNISTSAIAMYESGQRIPRDEIKIRIAEYYETPVESIFFPQKPHETCEKMNAIDALFAITQCHQA